MSKNYLIVGGSSGIGLALVQQLLVENHAVWVMSRKEGDLAGLPSVGHIAVDVVADDIPTDDLPEHLDGVVYCPGSITLKPFRSLKPEQFREDFELNVIGAVKVLQATQKLLKKSGDASVVLFSTVAVGQGMAFHASIAAAKGAIEGLTKSLAAEMAPKVRVNCIAPSLTDTPLAERLLSTADKKEASDKRHPLKRVGQPEEIAALAAFLLSEKGSWMSGQILGMDGGMSTLRV
jgi:NAD(P)-dependent dehydrogenase (short-subunit alcohol dehydrogenase family)